MRLIFTLTRAHRGAKPGVSPLVSSGTCGVSRGTGSPWKCAESFRHIQRDMRLIFIPRPAPTGARNRWYRRWFRQEPAAYPGGLGPPGDVYKRQVHDPSEVKLLEAMVFDLTSQDDLRSVPKAGIPFDEK